MKKPLPVRRLGALVAAAGLVLAGAATAAADNLQLGDVVTINGTDTVAILACLNEPASKTVSVRVTRAGGANSQQVFGNAADVTLTSGNSVGGVTAEFDDGKITLIDGWVDAGNGTLSETETVTISIPAKTADGSGSIRLFGTGIGSSASSVTRDAYLAVNWTVTDCAPPNTAPELSLPVDIIAEATGPGGAAVNYTATATDAEDGSLTPTCAPTSGSTFPLGATTVNCTVTDLGGLSDTGSFTVTVQDTTPPELTLPLDITAEATGPDGAAVMFSASATDIVDGDVSVVCDPVSGSTFALGSTTVNCTATDAAGNEAKGSFMVTVEDTTAPTLTLPGNITTPATGPSGAVVDFTVTAEDAVDPNPVVICTPASGSTFEPGTTTVNCTATDASGNSGSGSFTVTVQYQLSGFYRPVTMGALNTVKAGSTVPLKFEIFASDTELTSTSVITSFTTKQVKCTAPGELVEDAVEIVTTGGTSLRYDATEGQFIQNWKTPKNANTCHIVTMTTQDGSSLSALFKLK